ncbi:MAG: hypothetical protein LBQ98_09185, partial [Nitrososphaerota archaeon]|nr:hypothetical protein [Nitrososphaerota archaeon]
MKDVPKAIQTTYEKIKANKKTHIELKKINGHYYVYTAHSHWDKQQKKPIKTTHFIGKITPDGQYHPKTKKTKTTTTQTYQYGNSELCLNLSKNLQQTTPNLPYANELLALTLIRITTPTPITLSQTA